MSNMSENSEIKWYVVHTYSGYENKVKVNLEKSVENNGLQDKIVEVCIPVEEAVEIKNNKRKTPKSRAFPRLHFARHYVPVADVTGVKIPKILHLIQ